jgi:hypothetical protein
MIIRQWIIVGINKNKDAKFVTKKMKILAKRVSRNKHSKNYGLRPTLSGMSDRDFTLMSSDNISKIM